MIRYTVRHSNGRTWAVDRIHQFGTRSLFAVENTRYFATEEQARSFKTRKEAEK